MFKKVANTMGAAFSVKSDKVQHDSKRQSKIERVDTYQLQIAQCSKLLAEKLVDNFYYNYSFASAQQELDPSFEQACHHLSVGIHLMLQTIEQQQKNEEKKQDSTSQDYKKLADQQFSNLFATAVVTTVSETMKEVVSLTEKEQFKSTPIRTDIPSFCEAKDYYLLDTVQSTAGYVRTPYHRLKEFKPFLLDNSIRESTVAQVRGHVKADKYAILNAVEQVGVENIIVGAFGELPRVEDDWLDELHRLGKMKPNFWAFCELRDDVINGKPLLDMPLGLRKIIKYQIPNAIIELDIGCPLTDWKVGDKGSWTNGDHCELMKQRIITFQENVSPQGKTFVNYRDAVKMFPSPDASRRMVEFTVYLAKLPPALRPLGLLFEEPAGDAFPWQIRDVVRVIRKAMDDNGWGDGELLIHVHKNYGFCEAVIQEALAHGATGLWAGISEEGAGTGTGASILTFTNLARMKNPHVQKLVNFPKMYHASREITLITTGQEPHPKIEIYGSRAMDVLWKTGFMGSSDFDLSLVFDVPSNIRISTFTTPALFREHLANTFGNHPEDWEMEVAERMQVQLHEDLLSEEKFDYQTPVGLYDLYVRSGGKKFLREMMEIVMQSKEKKTTNGTIDDHHPLMVELKRMYDLYADDNGRMDNKSFFFCFINRFISCYNFPCPKFNAVLEAIDVDKSGDIDWPEISVWAKWAIEEYNLTPENCDIDRLTHMIFVGHIFPVAFRNLYKLKVKSKKYIAEVMYRGDED